MSTSQSESPTHDAERALPSSAQSKVIRGGLLGSIVEFYDFGVYGYMAVAISHNFFVGSDDNAALLGTFAAFAVAFFLRVPGGVLFGHIGDRFGRKRALTWTIMLMTVATGLMGVLPTYATAGIWAAVLLTLSRCLQGLSAGGENSGGNIFVAEHAPPRWRAFHTSTVNAGTCVGALLSSLIALILTSALGKEAVDAWAWRLPFLLSLVLGVVGFWIRARLEEPPQFAELRSRERTERVPVVAVLRTSWRRVLVVMGLNALMTGGYYIASVYSASYLQSVGGRSPQFAFVAASVALAVGIVVMIAAGYLGDRIGRRPVLFAGSIAGLVLGFPMFYLMAHGPAFAAAIGPVVLFACVSFFNGVSFACYSEMFTTEVRYSGLALASNTTNMILGGSAPFIATYLVGATGNTLAPGGYFVLCAAISLIACFFVKETKGAVLSARPRRTRGSRAALPGGSALS
ncbi:MAG TPA: MFS transporter [Amycolatopsis sp.]|nr:MFS transporter [Amycolatopsis sp.]